VPAKSPPTVAGKFRNTKLAKQQAAKLENMFTDMDRGRGQAWCPSSSRPTCRVRKRRWPQSLLKLSTDEVKVQMVYAGVGGVSESDVNLAIASKAVIIGFNTRADAGARKTGRRQLGIDIRYYNIIYDAVDECEGAMSRHADARQERGSHRHGRNPAPMFQVASKIGTVAGCMVTSGHGYNRTAQLPPAAQQHRDLHRRTRLAQALQGRRARKCKRRL
jgi:translation initiation factor IF-2